MVTIQGIYVALFGRPADPAGLAYWTGQTQNGLDLTFMLASLPAEAEYTSRFEGMNNTQIINSIYQALFGRDADAGGLAFFLSELASGNATIATIAVHILSGAKGDDLALIEAKLDAADLFTARLDLDEERAAYNGDQAAQVGRDFLSGVTVDAPATNATTDAAIQLLFGNGGGGQAPGGGGVVNPPAPTFTIVEGEDGISFGGTANGTITLTSIVDGDENNVLAGTRGNASAVFPNGPIFSYPQGGLLLSQLPANIILSGELEVVISAAAASGSNSISGDGYVRVFGSDGVQTINVGASQSWIAGGQGADKINLTEGVGFDRIVVDGVDQDLIDAVAAAEAELEGKDSAEDLEADLGLAQEALDSVASEEELQAALEEANSNPVLEANRDDLVSEDDKAEDLVDARAELKAAVDATGEPLAAAQSELEAANATYADEVEDQAEASAAATEASEKQDAAEADLATKTQTFNEANNAAMAAGATFAEKQAEASAAAATTVQKQATLTSTTNLEVTAAGNVTTTAAAQDAAETKATGTASTLLTATNTFNTANTNYNTAVSQTNTVTVEVAAKAVRDVFYGGIFSSSETNRQNVTTEINKLNIPAGLKAALIGAIPQGFGTFDENSERNTYTQKFNSIYSTFLEALNTTKTNAQAALTTATANNTAAQAELAAATTAENEAKAALIAATEAKNAAKIAYDAAVLAQEEAEAAYDQADADLTAAFGVLSAAQTAKEQADVQLEAANAAEAKAQADLVAANGDLQDATEARDAAQSDYDSALKDQTDAKAALDAHIAANGSDAELAADAEAAQAALDAYDAAAKELKDAQDAIDHRAQLVEAVEAAQALVDERETLDGNLADAQAALDAVFADSVVGSEDSVTGFDVNSDHLKLPTSQIIADDDGFYEDGGINYAYNLTDGVLTISNGGEPATINSQAQLNALLKVLSIDEVVADGDTLVFEFNIDGVEGTYVFQGAAGAKDIGVKLIDVTGVTNASDLFFTQEL